MDRPVYQPLILYMLDTVYIRRVVQVYDSSSIRDQPDYNQDPALSECVAYLQMPVSTWMAGRIVVGSTQDLVAFRTVGVISHSTVTTTLKLTGNVEYVVVRSTKHSGEGAGEGTRIVVNYICDGISLSGCD